MARDPLTDPRDDPWREPPRWRSPSDRPGGGDEDADAIDSDADRPRDGAADAIDSGPGEHDAHLMGEDQPFRTVPCSHCGGLVWEEAKACRRCGHLFADQAFNDPQRPVQRARQLLVVLLVIAMLLTLLLNLRWF